MRKLPLAIGLAAACTGLLGVPASATQPASHAAPHLIAQHETRAGMYATGINAKVAAAHGYAVINLADGSTVSIKKTTLARLGANPSAAALKAHTSSVVAAKTESGLQPNNTVYGNCGDSYYYLSIYSGGTWESTTGYTVREAVASKDWHTYLQDPSGSVIGGTSYDSGRSDSGWTGTDENPPKLTKHGTWLGGVDVGTVVLVDGTSCVSGDPSDTAEY